MNPLPDNHRTSSAEIQDDDAPMRMELTHNAYGQLCVKDANDQWHTDVRPVRLFPLSRPDQWIALFHSSGTEIAYIENPSELSEASRTALENELGKREFVPKINRILSTSGNTEPCEWRVETDRGNTSFILKDEKDVRRLGDHSVLILDSHGIRYLIPDRHALDSTSRRIIEWYV